MVVSLDTYNSLSSILECDTINPVLPSVGAALLLKSVEKKEKHEGRISLHLFVYPLRRSTRYRAASSPAIAKTDVKPGTPFLGSLCVGAEVFTSTGVLTTSSVETQTGSPSIMRKREYHSGTSINRTAVLGDQCRKGLADVDVSWKIPSIPCFDRYRLCACTR